MTITMSSLLVACYRSTGSSNSSNATTTTTTTTAQPQHLHECRCRRLMVVVLVALYTLAIMTFLPAWLPHKSFSAVTTTTTIHETKEDDNANNHRIIPMIPTTDHAIVVPLYRKNDDRDESHLQAFIQHMTWYLRNHDTTENNDNDHSSTTFSLWIVEQDDDELFNRAWLANVGIAQAIQTASTSAGTNTSNSCIILHDVDLIPLSPSVPYTQCHVPIQLSSELQSHRWSVPYSKNFGGVVALNVNHWKLINGLSNGYPGWGGEDDEYVFINKLSRRRCGPPFFCILTRQLYHIRNSLKNLPSFFSIQSVSSRCGHGPL
jgi:hypothetical protein